MAKMVMTVGDQGLFGFACGWSANQSAQNSRISVTAESGGLKVSTPYNAGFVNQLKIYIPSTARKWDGGSKCWYVAPSYAPELKRIIDEAYGVDVQMPTVIGASDEVFETTFQADYVANCKAEAASVHAGGSWTAKIPELVLRAWFKQTVENENNYYGLLGCDEKAGFDEIKKAYKRAARIWHPDVCREENSVEMFRNIKNAFDVLSNPEARAKYNAGLFFEKMAHMQPKASRYTSFVPMLRCGVLTVKAKKSLGVLIVEEILKWDDITNEFGQTMVSYWNGDSFAVMWL